MIYTRMMMNNKPVLIISFNMEHYEILKHRVIGYVGVLFPDGSTEWCSPSEILTVDKPMEFEETS